MDFFLVVLLDVAPATLLDDAFLFEVDFDAVATGSLGDDWICMVLLFFDARVDGELELDCELEIDCELELSSSDSTKDSADAVLTLTKP